MRKKKKKSLYWWPELVGVEDYAVFSELPYLPRDHFDLHALVDFIWINVGELGQDNGSLLKLDEGKGGIGLVVLEAARRVPNDGPADDLTLSAELVLLNVP